MIDRIIILWLLMICLEISSFNFLDYLRLIKMEEEINVLMENDIEDRAINFLFLITLMIMLHHVIVNVLIPVYHLI